MKLILDYIRDHKNWYPKIDVVQSVEKVFTSTLFIVLPQNGIRLHFDGKSQHLRLIEVLEWGSLAMTYKNTEISKSSALDFKQIYFKVFGPTYAGNVEASTNVYFLTYPGLTFRFDLNQSQLDLATSCDPVTAFSKDTPVCSAMAIFSGESLADHFDREEPLKVTAIPSEPKIFPDMEITQARVVPGSSVTFTINTLTNGSEEYTAKFGSSTLQSVIMAFGPPSERYVKRDSRLLIHNPNDESDAEFNLFLNYFDLGIDFCFDTKEAPPTLNKIILHGNLPASLEFQRYSRCRWTLEDNYLNSEDSVSKLLQRFPRANGPVMLNRTLDSPGSSSMEFIGEDDSTSGSGTTWGLTKLYAIKGCIYEVLALSGLITSLTVYSCT